MISTHPQSEQVTHLNGRTEEILSLEAELREKLASCQRPTRATRRFARDKLRELQEEKQPAE